MSKNYKKSEISVMRELYKFGIPFDGFSHRRHRSKLKRRFGYKHRRVAKQRELDYTNEIDELR